MNSIRKILDKILEVACILIFGIMTILVVYQVVTRYVFQSPSSWSESVVTYGFIWLAMLGGAYVFGKRDHMRMVFFIERFNKNVQARVGIITEIVVLLFAVGVLISGGAYIAVLSITQTTPALGISMGYIYMVLPVCGIITAIYSVLNIFDLMKKSKEA